VDARTFEAILEIGFKATAMHSLKNFSLSYYMLYFAFLQVRLPEIANRKKQKTA